MDFFAARRSFHTLEFENLEQRVCLDGGGLADCQIELAMQTDAARAARAINCFALDLYQHMQQEQGNLLFSPLSVSTSLAMFYAGASGETASQMETVLHLGTEDGIHESFAALMDSIESVGNDDITLELANAMWPQMDIVLRDQFVDTVQIDYGGEATSLNYSDTQQAVDTINAWVAQKTHDQIQDLLKSLPRNTLMAVTNAIYFDSIWANLFEPAKTVNRTFYLDDGTIVVTPMMQMTADFAVTQLNGFRALEMPFAGDRVSMVWLLPDHSGIDLTPDVLSQVDKWMADARQVQGMSIRIPKFTITVATQLEGVLADMGMPQAFHGADFSNMTPHPLSIDVVRHKAFLQVDESGAEAAAATVIGGGDCFAAGTPVLTIDGEKPIETLRPGDYVLARDEFDEKGPIEQKRIEEVFCHSGETVSLQVRGQAIRVTKRHPFYVKDQGWTLACDLRTGDHLAVDLRGWAKVERIEMKSRVEPVFNFRVADHHTYFVGGESWGFAVWVHNCSAGQCFFLKRPFHFLIRDNETSSFLFMGRVSDPTQSENVLMPTVDRLVGDSNGDGIFNSSDLVHVFNAGKYDDGIPRNATYEEGDWNRDGDFDSSDFVFAFQSGQYARTASPLKAEIAATAAEFLFAQSDQERRAFVT